MVRSATAADIDRLIELGRAMHEESSTYSRLAFDEPRLRELLGRMIENTHDDAFVVVAEVSGHIVGFMLAMVSAHWMSSDLVASDLALYVQPNCRRHGVARDMIAAYVAWSIKSGAALILAATSVGGKIDATEQLYVGEGFTKCGLIFEA